MSTTAAEPTTRTSVLELDNVGKSYGHVHALRGVNIDVKQGEVTCVLGDNGAGKSTLIKIVAGLHDYTEGTMKIDGQARHFGSPRVAQATGIATVYQDLAPRPADVGMAELLPRQRASQRAVPQHPRDEAGRGGGADQDGHRHPRPRPAGRQPVRRSAPVRGDRSGDLLRPPAW